METFTHSNIYCYFPNNSIFRSNFVVLLMSLINQLNLGRKNQADEKNKAISIDKCDD